jgi:hypothetical protein
VALGKLLVGCAAVSDEEIVIDIKTTGDGADGVEPDLLIRHVAQVGVSSDARGAADAVQGGIVGVARAYIPIAVRIGHAVLDDPVKGTSHAVLDADHRLDQRGRVKEPAAFASPLVLNSRQERPAEAIAPIHLSLVQRGDGCDRRSSRRNSGGRRRNSRGDIH